MRLKRKHFAAIGFAMLAVLTPIQLYGGTNCC